MPRKATDTEGKTKPSGKGASKRGQNEGTKVMLHKSGRYYAQVSVGGKRVTVYGETKEEVKAKRDALTVQARRGQLATPDKMTLGQWLDRWLELQRPHISPTSADLYRTRLTLYVPEKLKAKRLQAITRGDLMALNADLARREATTRTRGKEAKGLGRPLSLDIRSKVFQHLRAAFKEAKRQDLIAVNYAEDIEVRATATNTANRTKAADKALTEEEMLRFLDVAQADALYPAFYTMFSLGLRRGEALGLRWRDVDFTTGLIRIEQQVKTQGNRAVVGPLKTQESRRAIQASPDLLAVLQERQDRQAEHRAILGEAWTETGLVFTTELGTLYHPRNVNRTIERLCKRAGIRHFSSHAARHTVISQLLKGGANLEVVSSIAGHARPSITADLYRTVYEDEKRATVYSIEEQRAKRPRAQA